MPRCLGQSRASVKLFWLPPVRHGGEPAITSYRISWRVGGSTTLGFSLQKEVNAGDCMQFTRIKNERGEQRTVPLPELATIVAELASEVPYEFRVAAVSEVGTGPWSEVSFANTQNNVVNSVVFKLSDH
jgi:hypothetical protein